MLNFCTHIDDIFDDPIQGGCYLCEETVLWGADYQVHLITAHEEVHLTSAGPEGEDDVFENDVIEDDEIIDEVIEDNVIEDEVIEDPVACYLCGETVLPGQDYKVHLAAAHRLTKVRIKL